MSKPVPLIRSQVYLGFERAGDGKQLYVDPDEVVGVEYGGAEITTLHLPTGEINVQGDVDDVVSQLASGRAAAAEVSLSALVHAVYDEVKILNDKKGLN